ncbi:hypothetical protein [Streptomyces antibioticus]|uniref:hypothetical protein n=1 Tax=Streptomyces antibioticus TaxID=1890 RepID=UPI003F48E328
MTDTGARIVLVKPGDILIIGNAGTLDDASVEASTEAISRLHQALGLAGVVLFEGDIELATVAQHIAAQQSSSCPERTEQS